MPRMGGNYGSYEGGSGLADLLSGAVSGFKTGRDLAAQRAAQKLAEEREARFEQERLDQAKERELARERQAALDAMQGILPSDSVDMNEQVVTASGAPARDATKLAASAGRALSSLTGGFDSGAMLEGTADQITDKTENRYQQVGDRAIDRTRYDAGLKQRMGEEEVRQDEGRERRALLSLTNPDGTPMLRNEEVLGRSGKGLEAISGRASTMGLDQRLAREASARAEAKTTQEREAKEAAAVQVAQSVYGLSPEVAANAARSGLLTTVLGGIEAQRASDRALSRGLALASATRPAGAGGAGAAGGGVNLLPTSQDERIAAMHYTLGLDAVGTLEGRQGSWVGEQVDKLPFVGNVLQNRIAPQQAELDQAARQLVESYIWSMTGAAAPQQQMDRIVRTVKPEAGDSPGVLEQKAKTRGLFLRAIRGRGGRAIQNMMTQGIIAPDGSAVAVAQPTTAADEAAAAEAKELYNSLRDAGISAEDATEQVEAIYGGAQ